MEQNVIIFTLVTVWTDRQNKTHKQAPRVQYSLPYVGAFHGE